MGGYHFSSPMNRIRSTFSVVSASRKKMGFLSFVPRARSHSARRWRVSLSWTIVVSMKGLDPLRKSCPPLFGAVMALTAHIFATFATTSVNISCWSIRDSPRISFVLIHRRAVSGREEGVDLVFPLVERQRVSAFLRRHGFEVRPAPPIEDVNNSRGADGDIDVVQSRIEKDNVRRA